MPEVTTSQFSARIPEMVVIGGVLRHALPDAAPSAGERQ
jgi:hypothetical protein